MAHPFRWPLGGCRLQLDVYYTVSSAFDLVQFYIEGKEKKQTCKFLHRLAYVLFYFSAKRLINSLPLVAGMEAMRQKFAAACNRLKSLIAIAGLMLRI